MHLLAGTTAILSNKSTRTPTKAQSSTALPLNSTASLRLITGENKYYTITFETDKDLNNHQVEDVIENALIAYANVHLQSTTIQSDGGVIVVISSSDENLTADIIEKEVEEELENEYDSDIDVTVTQNEENNNEKNVDNNNGTSFALIMIVCVILFLGVIGCFAFWCCRNHEFKLNEQTNVRQNGDDTGFDYVEMLDVDQNQEQETKIVNADDDIVDVVNETNMALVAIDENPDVVATVNKTNIRKDDSEDFIVNGYSDDDDPKKPTIHNNDSIDDFEIVADDEITPRLKANSEGMTIRAHVEPEILIKSVDTHDTQNYIS